jgi:hypothetical protein
MYSKRKRNKQTNKQKDIYAFNETTHSLTKSVILIFNIHFFFLFNKRYGDVNWWRFSNSFARSFHRRIGVFCKRLTDRATSPVPVPDKTILFPRVNASSIIRCSGVLIDETGNIFFLSSLFRCDDISDVLDRLCIFSNEECCSKARTCFCTRPANSSLSPRILSRPLLSTLIF